MTLERAAASPPLEDLGRSSGLVEVPSEENAIEEKEVAEAVAGGSECH